MANWDEETLNNVINQKHGEAEKSKPKTAIVRENAGDSRSVPVIYLLLYWHKANMLFKFVHYTNVRLSVS